MFLVLHPLQVQKLLAEADDLGMTLQEYVDGTFGQHVEVVEATTPAGR